MSKEVSTQYAGLDLGATRPDHVFSWVDRFTGWVARLPGPSWLFYLAVWLLLYLLFNVLWWVDGSAAVGYFHNVPGLWASYLIYYLAFMHYLKGVASRALRTSRPALIVSDADFERLHQEMVTMPRAKALQAGGIGILLTLIFTASPVSIAAQVEKVSPLAAILGVIVTLLGNFFIATSIYQSVRQLRIVSRIHKTATQVSLFRREPLYAFSILTARTGVGFALAMWFGVAPRTGAAVFSQATEWVVALVLQPLTIAAFVLPLVNIQQLIAKEKKRMRGEVALRLEMIIDELNRCVDERALNKMGELKMTLDTLLAEREVIAKTPTWPWQLGTVAGFFSAFALPVIIWLTQQGLSRLMGH